MAGWARWIVVIRRWLLSHRLLTIVAWTSIVSLLLSELLFFVGGGPDPGGVPWPTFPPAIFVLLISFPYFLPATFVLTPLVGGNVAVFLGATAPTVLEVLILRSYADKRRFVRAFKLLLGIRLVAVPVMFIVLVLCW